MPKRLGAAGQLRAQARSVGIDHPGRRRENVVARWGSGKDKVQMLSSRMQSAIEYAHKRPGNRSMNIDMYGSLELRLFYIYAEDRPCTLAIASGDRRRHRKTGRGPGSCPPAPRGNH